MACPICMDAIKDAVALPCAHTFCRVCINRCAEDNGCPICRAPFAAAGGGGAAAGDWTKEDLKALLRNFSLTVSGDKKTLYTRLIQHTAPDLTTMTRNMLKAFLTQWGEQPKSSTKHCDLCKSVFLLRVAQGAIDLGHHHI